MPRALAALLFASLAGWSPTWAQVPGLPLWRPLAPPGVVLEGDAAWPSDEAGGGSVVGASVGFGEGNIALRGTVAWVNPAATDPKLGWAALGRIGLVASRSSPFRVGAFAGIGGARVTSGAASGTTYRVPLGLDVGVVIPTPVLVLDAWVAPRLDLATVNPLQSSRLDARAAFAVGLDLVLGSGIGARVGYDYVILDELDQSTFGLGLFFRFEPGF